MLHRAGFWIHSHAISFDGRLCAVGDVRGIVMLWDISSLELIREFSADEVSISSIAFSPDGTQLATGGYRGKITLWDIPTGQKRATLKAHASEIRQLAFAEKANKLVSLSWSGAARVWDLDTFGDTGLRIQKQNAVGTGKAGYSPDGKWLPVVQQQTVDLWATQPMRRVHQFADSSAFCTEFTPDSKTLVVGNRDGVVRFWDVDTGHQRGELSLEGLTPQAGIQFAVNSLSVSPDGRYLAASFGWPHEDYRPASPKDVTVWSIDTGKVVATFPHPNRVMKVAFSRDAQALATACYDGKLRLWNTTDWQRTHVLEAGDKASPGLLSLAFRSHQGQEHIAAGDFHGNIHLWDLENRTKIGTLSGHPTQSIDLEFSPDQRVLASSSYDGTVRIWDWPTSRELCVLRDHQATWVSSVSFAPDGRTLTSQSYTDGVAREWPTTPSFWRDSARVVSELERIRRDSPYTPTGLSLAQTVREHPTIWRLLAERLPNDPIVMMGMSRIHDDAGEKEEAFNARQGAIRRLSVIVEKDTTNVGLADVMTDLLLEHVASQIECTILTPAQAQRVNGEPLHVLSDGTVIVDGDAMLPESFVLRASTDLSEISALAIDAIPDPKYKARGNISQAFQYQLQLSHSGADPSGLSVRPTSMMVNWTGYRVMPGLTIETAAGRTAHVCLTNFHSPASIVIATQSDYNASPNEPLEWHFRMRPLHGKMRIKTTSNADAYCHEWLANDHELDPLMRLAAAYFLVGEWQKSLGTLRSLEAEQQTTLAKLLTALCLSKLGEDDLAVTEYRAVVAQLDEEFPTVGLSILEQIADLQFSNLPADDLQQPPATSLLDRQLEDIERRLTDPTMPPWEPWCYLQCLEARLDLGFELSTRHLKHTNDILSLSLSQADFRQASTALEVMLRAQADRADSSAADLDQFRFRLWQVRERLQSDLLADGLLNHELNHPLRQAEMVLTIDGSTVDASELLQGPVITLFLGSVPNLPVWQFDRICQLEREYRKAGLLATAQIMAPSW